GLNRCARGDGDAIATEGHRRRVVTSTEPECARRERALAIAVLQPLLGGHGHRTGIAIPLRGEVAYMRKAVLACNGQALVVAAGAEGCVRLADVVTELSGVRSGTAAGQAVVPVDVEHELAVLAPVAAVF